ncbi:hypothetical protein CJP74_06810 [Psittacicella melopsittaci]|uniref:YcgL domain-containing protein n=1 Tax=Psittacicella melopsittaci TaxID=2028576 RepID=A0A3A1Y2J5_9GAMM|nr:YcgL domain-containing protein [Psittacicella melopsittaci]RIY31630.1 hypothetical protein CJP74_06810 [Psittacicella melopsittaci]
MLVSIYVTKDSKYFLYVPFNPKFKTTLDLYEDVPPTIKDKFKSGRFVKTIDSASKKLVQIEDLEQFHQTLTTNGYYLFKIDEEFVERQIQNALRK